MSLKLHLGVFELPYTTHVPEVGRRAVARLRKGGSPEKFTSAPAGAETTGDVASILEAEYHIIEIFYQANQQAIADFVAASMAGALETMLMGGPPPKDPLAQAYADIEKLFKNFILSGAIESLGVPGVPTQAALDGVNHALKLKKGPRRPSFKDTGLYMSAFHTWSSNG